ncbi:MAG: polysaccharide pyruvyl transferase family protein [Limisphaerales bacterium]
MRTVPRRLEGQCPGGGFQIIRPVLGGSASSRVNRAILVKARQITLYGHFGVQNLGNECTLQAIIHNMSQRLPDAKFQCLSTVREDTVARHNVPAFPARAAWPDWLSGWLERWRSRRARGPGRLGSLRSGGAPEAAERAAGEGAAPGQRGPVMRWLRIICVQIPKDVLHWAKGLWIVGRTDMLVVPGTGVVADYLTGPFSYPYDIFKWSTIARLCRARVLFVSIGAGPICHPLSRWFLKTSLASAHHRSYRDAASKKCVEGLGLDVNGDRVCPDLAFGLPRSLFTERSPDRDQKPVIGVGLKDYYGPRNAGEQPDAKAYRDYLGAMAGFVTWLREHGYPVRVLIGDVLYDTSVIRDLMHLLKERGLGKKPGEIVCEPMLTVEQLLAQLSTTDIVISPRFHNLVLALMLNKPVIALSDHQKLDSLMEGFDLAGYCLPLLDLTVEKLSRKLVELEKSAEQLRPCIRQKVEQYREDLDREYAAIFPAEQARCVEKCLTTLPERKS